MKKVGLCIAFLLALVCAVQTFAAEPAVTSDAVAYIHYNKGSNENDGLTANTPKQMLLALADKGCISLLKDGGTLVACGKIFVGGSYTMPKLGSALLITSNDGTTNYLNELPIENPSTAFKMNKNAVFTVQSDVIFDDIILFQEYAASNTIKVTNGATLMIGPNVICTSNLNLKEEVYMTIEVEAGATAILYGGIFQKVVGAGTIINKGALIVEDGTEESDPVIPTAPVTVGGVTVTSNSIAYISYNSGNNTKNTGLSASSPKQQMNTLSSTGAISLLADGGRLVACGKIFVGGDYTLPELASPLLVTSNDGSKNYMNEMPIENPATAFKMNKGATMILQSDVIFDDIILFQEYADSSTLKVTNNSTLVIGPKARCVTNINLSKEMYMTIEVEAGSTAILETGIFQKVIGEGTVINKGATILEGENYLPKFTATRTYTDQFTDVAANAWYYTYVKTAYEYALANGTSQTKFNPDGKFTVAQALTVAANIHTAYNRTSVRAVAVGETWYAPYVEYCIENGIITETQFANYSQNITRGEMAIVFANILPDSEYAAVRSGSNPDVTADMACASAVAKLYCAGIVGGDAKTGNYRPNDEIVRSEACVIFARIAVTDFRAK